MIKKLHKLTLIIGLLISGLVSAQDAFIGEIKMFAGNFAPVGYALCNGQILSISSNPALFSIIGTTYGGDGSTTFALPDLRGRVAMHAGNGPGLTPRSNGQKGGAENNYLSIGQMPSHNHTINASSSVGNVATPTGNLPADTSLFDKEYSDGAANTTMKSTMVGSAGSGQSVNNVQPYTVIRYIIALQGIYPSQN